MAASETVTARQDAPRVRRRGVGGAIRRLPRRPGFWSVALGGVVVLVFILAGLLAPVLAPHDPQDQHLAQQMLPPVWSGGSAEYPLGTDSLGRDILSRILYGARISLLVGGATALGAGVLGITLGLLGGYRGGTVDYVIQRVLEVFQAFPFLLLAIVVMAVLGPGVWNLILVLVLSRWVQFCRVVRAEALSLRTREFVVSARAMGSGGLRTAIRHVLPSVLAPAIVVATFSLATAIIGEASLSFLGVGVPPQVPTWGTMLAEGRDYMFANPWLTVGPGIALFITVVAVNVLGDGLRDMSDPKLRGR